MSLKSTVWNAEEGRPRTPVRIVAGVVILVIATVALVVPPLAVLSVLEVALLAGTGIGATVLSTGLSGLGAILGVWLAGRYVDRRRFADFGMGIDREWWLDCGFGLALGALLMTGIFLLELAAGWIEVTGAFAGEALARVVVGSVVLFLIVGIYEELLLRGYLLTNLAEGARGPLGIGGAIVFGTVASSLVFGALHASNPNATLVSTLAISFAGVMLALGYVLTDELAIPIGLHVTWNLFQGTVYGFPVSGMDFGTSIVGVEQGGPTVVTGGSFGPEAGLVGFCAMIAGCLATVAWVRWRRGSVGIREGVALPDLR
ncbi:CPBP family intramembrane glutamic endopeptidase [Halalkalicoccus jeotgali]|uniref:Abortive infection protein n=1 Tax=Halalkalicoccus jeotgali (strain DSM 18796 / CECT 7217 / JCM 14584 / KCTC 4019 / B3) TaxID=795797 RepID=D8J607_HALJB|nr:type II CAAX endopeptidase family protein [Halalkalicoccus jeotgali]ADJ13813.1 abortive infection protein [Halalkalicoccus jeotgali B3]ELY34141.1 abortive infection protein [Halalkalicoccus jeotgali B3]